MGGMKFDAESFAMHLCKWYFSCVVIASIIERNAECRVERIGLGAPL